MRMTEGSHQNDTKCFLSSTKQFTHEVHLVFDCLFNFILPLLALADFPHIIFIKMSTCHKWALDSGEGKLSNKMGCEHDKYHVHKAKGKNKFLMLGKVLIDFEILDKMNNCL